MNSPKHYGDNRLMDLLIDKQVPFAEGNIMKYVFRWREKDGLRDLKKAHVYLSALVAHAELEQVRNSGEWVQADLFPVSTPQGD